MRILILSQYFWPESFAINDLVRQLEARGHILTVATGKPNYPSGEIAPTYRNAGVQRERYAKSVEVIRVPLRPRGRGDTRSLVLNYLSFMASASLRLPWLLRRRPFDVIFVYAVSPLTAAIPAVLLRRLKRTHLVFWVQDLWPDAVAASGHVRSRMLLNCIGFMTNKLYDAADTILVQSEGFRRAVSQRTSAEKIFYFPNTTPEEAESEPALPQWLLDVFDQNFFSIVFAGNLGKVQSLDTILGAAALLKVSEPQLRFVLIGSGSESDRLARRIAEEKLTNITMVGQVDRDWMPPLLARADCLLVTLEDNPGLNLTIPSKLQTYFKAGKPIVGAINGEGARAISESGAGLVVPSGNKLALAKAIVDLNLMSSEKRAALGSAGKAFADAKFSADRWIDSLIGIMETRIANSRV